MAFVHKMTLTVLLCLATHIGYVQGAQCTTEEGCREYLSCKTGGTVYCCPGGERLVVNGTSGVCNCDETGSSGLYRAAAELELARAPSSYRLNQAIRTVRAAQPVLTEIHASLVRPATVVRGVS